MSKPVKIVLLAVIGMVILIQFFQPERNRGIKDTEDDLFVGTMAPDSLVSLLKTSCYDCHSNHTDYPWYGNVSPVSWMLNRHVQKGREELNFSSFGKLEKNQQIGALSDICDVVESGRMPLKSYLLIHRDARLTQQEIEAICTWTESEALQLMRQ